MDAEERHICVLLIYGLENSAAYHLVVIVVTTNTVLLVTTSWHSGTTNHQVALLLCQHALSAGQKMTEN